MTGISKPFAVGVGPSIGYDLVCPVCCFCFSLRKLDQGPNPGSDTWGSTAYSPRGALRPILPSLPFPLG